MFRKTEETHGKQATKARRDCHEVAAGFCGLVATKAVAKNANLPVMVRLSEDTQIFDAWQNEPWLVNGAAVRVAIVCCSNPEIRHPVLRLNGEIVENINPNLTSGLNTTTVAKLAKNAGTVFIGVQQSGPLTVPRETAKEWGDAPTNPNGRKNSDILARYVSTEDVVGRPTEEFLIDFPVGLSSAQASAFEQPYEHLSVQDYDPFRNGDLVRFPEYRESTPSQNSSWWEPHRPRPDMRAALRSVSE